MGGLRGRPCATRKEARLSLNSHSFNKLENELQIKPREHGRKKLIKSRGDRIMTGLRKHRAPATRATIPVTTTSLWVKEQETASSPRRTDAVPAHAPLSPPRQPSGYGRRRSRPADSPGAGATPQACAGSCGANRKCATGSRGAERPCGRGPGRCAHAHLRGGVFPTETWAPRPRPPPAPTQGRREKAREFALPAAGRADVPCAALSTSVQTWTAPTLKRGDGDYADWTPRSPPGKETVRRTRHVA